MDPHLLRQNIAKLQDRLSRCTQKYQFHNSDILVLAVSKTRPVEDIRVAYECGLTQFGENYLQEAVDKIAALEDLPLTWHFIGPIQSNKTRQIAEHFHWVHSIDREKIARRLSEQRPDGLPPLQVCLQVNVSGEQSKSGVEPGELRGLAEAVLSLPALRLRGLMAIPAVTKDEAQQRAAFRSLRELKDSLADIAPAMDTLSMGMSGDLEAAVAEGSTLVRIGTAIFGPRDG